MANAPRDENRVTTLLGVDSTLFAIPTTVAVDPLTHAMLVNASVTIDTSLIATSANQTSGNQKTQIVDAGGEQVTVTGGKLDVNASIDTTGLATSAKQDTGNTSLSSIDTKIPASPSTTGKQDTGNTSLASIDGKVTDVATQATLALIKAKTDNIDVALSTRTKPADTQTVAGTVTANAGTNLNTSALALDSTVAKDATISTTNTEIGIVTETAPASDTASSGLNGRLQRIAQRLTTLITNLGSPFQAGGSIGNTSFTATQATGTNLHVVVDSAPTTAVTGTFFQATQPVSGTVSTGLSQPLTDTQLRAVAVPVSGTVNPTTPTTTIAFVTTVTTAGTRVQLASNSIVAGILQAPSTNSGLIYVGGITVSNTVFGAELQAGQATGFAIDNTSKIYIDSSVNGDKCAFLGS